MAEQGFYLQKCSYSQEMLLTAKVNAYTRPEYIDYEGKGFESCLFFAIPESFKKLGKLE